jgi:hypothetical protein
MKALGRTPEEVPRALEYAHAQALGAAREVDPSFAVEMPSEVDDEADERTDPVRRMTFNGLELWFYRAGDDGRGYWNIEYDGDQWWVRECFVADGSGWNLRNRQSIGCGRPGPDLWSVLRRTLMAQDVPSDVADELLQHAIARFTQ